MEEQPRKRWQIPVLVVGVILLVLFGVNAVRQMTGGGAPRVEAKAPEKVKTPPVAETTEATTTPATPTPVAPASAIPENPEAELAGMSLPKTDPFAELVLPPGAGGEAGETGATGATGTPTGLGPEIPSEVPPPGLRRPAGPPGPGFPPALPDRTKRDTTISLVGTVLGARRLAVIRDDSQPEGKRVRVVGEGDRIGESKAVVTDIGPGSIRIQGKLRTHTLRAEDRAATEAEEKGIEEL